MKVLVGSENPVKIGAVRDAFEKVFGSVDVKGIKVNSHISNQPIGGETFEGARNRARELSHSYSADFYVGLEGGITNMFGKWFTFGVVCILDKNGKEGCATSSAFELPKSVVKDVLEGDELGVVMDRISGDHDSKKKGGAAGFFTRSAVSRKDVFSQATVLALAPFLRSELFKK